MATSGNYPRPREVAFSFGTAKVEINSDSANLFPKKFSFLLVGRLLVHMDVADATDSIAGGNTVAVADAQITIEAESVFVTGINTML